LEVTVPGASKGLKTVVAMLGVILVPAYLTLRTIHLAPPPAFTPGTNPSPHGYTISLLLFIVPAIAILWWFARRPQARIERSAFFLSVVWTAGIGIALDLFFGNAFFTFPNRGAILGILLPGYVPGAGWRLSIPIEEFIFYAAGFSAILLFYVWCDAYWFEAHDVAEMKRRARAVPRILQLHLGTATAAPLLLAAAVAYKRWGPHADHAGFPGYLTYLLLAAATPSLALFHSARSSINWRAFSLTIAFLLVVSLLWEVTLAIPYGWWGYRDRQMVGLYVVAWGHLPLEAVLVWVASSWGAVIIYESVRIALHMERPMAEALFGAEAAARLRRLGRRP
jgi:hypothetical protein